MAGPVVVTSRVVVVVTVVGSLAQPTSAHVANTNRDGVALLICFFGVMILPFLPRYSNFGWRVRKGTKNLAGKVLRLIQTRLATASLKKSRRRVKPIRRKRESQIQAQETRSAFHPRAQRNAFHRRGERQQRKISEPALGIPHHLRRRFARF